MRTKEAQAPRTNLSSQLGRIIILSTLVATGCARVVTPTDARVDGSRKAWGPISGAIVASEPKVVVLNQASFQREAKVAFETTKAVRVGDATQVAKFVSQVKPAPQADAQSIITEDSFNNPFRHPAPKVPLPEVFPNMNKVHGEPLPDKLGMADAQKTLAEMIRNKQLAPAPGSVIAPVAPAPRQAPIVVPASPVQQSNSALPPANTVAANEGAPKEAVRGRLADPRAANQVTASPDSVAAAQAPAAFSETSGSETFSRYKFSFTHEIWLLIFILGGVFATLWFRLEYDFGRRAARPRRF